MNLELYSREILIQSERTDCIIEFKVLPPVLSGGEWRGGGAEIRNPHIHSLNQKSIWRGIHWRK